MTKITELGIGIIYFSGFENVIESNSNLIDLIEIEPQTFWLKNRLESDSFTFNEKEIDYLQSIDKPKLFHGVGYPIGSSLSINTNHIPYLKDMMTKLNPLWLSEHLSFNNIQLEGDIYNTNFLLPPLQTLESINIASENIKKYRSNFDIPFAFETGVNYLQKHSFELDDGAFVNTIAEKSDSYILLDIHNLFANQLNGRQPVLEFIKQVDPERIIQIHMAGGFTYKDYYLDAHSGVSNDEVFSIFEKIVKMLPNLKAITFEMLPNYLELEFVSESDITKQLERMRSVWDKRGTMVNINHTPVIAKEDLSGESIPKVKEWEEVLGSLAIERSNEFTNGELGKELSKDKGLVVIQDLIKKFKSSLLVSSMKFTCRYLMLKYGLAYVNDLFADFWENSKPALFPTDNGVAFAKYLIEDLNSEDKVLVDLARFEVNSLKTLMDSKERVVNIAFNPNNMIDSLSEGKLPENLSLGNYEITIEPMNQVDTESISSVFHS